MKTAEYVAGLKTACDSVEFAPQKGFIDLDRIRQVMLDVKLFLENISPRLELGEKLIADFQNDLLNKLNAIKFSGARAPVSTIEASLKSDMLDYTQLKALQREIDAAFDSVFQGAGGMRYDTNKSTASRKTEDYH
jgi:hypothetical protein